jgi:2'-5' RNA ligase
VERSVRDIPPFALRLVDVTGMLDQYLFVNVKRGNDELIELHDRLYSGPLREHLSAAFTFVPHVTVGRLSGRGEFLRALAVASDTPIDIDTRVTSVCVYNAATPGDHHVESEVPLQRWPDWRSLLHVESSR